MFRSFLYNNFLFKNMNANKNIFYFQIGCYPSNKNNINHEFPKSLNKNDISLNYKLILIDPFYNINKNNKNNKTINDNNVDIRLIEYSENNIDVYIYDKELTNKDYNILIEFCHLLNYYNNLTIIMEFTSIIRKHHFYKDNITSKLYITESDCLADTNNILYNPIIQKEHINNEINYYFLRMENEINLYNFYLSTDNINEKTYIEALIIQRFKKIKPIYIKILDYMGVPVIYDDKRIKNNYDKNNKFINVLYNKLLYRLNNCYECSHIISEFKKSEYNNLEFYINNIIFNILLDCLKLIKEDDMEKIIFNNLKELKLKINYFMNILG